MSRVSLGLPVHNGEDFIAECIQSILRQTYTDFELLISDNASTDTTAKICQSFAERDSRIRYVRHETKMGAAENFNFTFHQTRGELFKWCAHDDVLAPDFLSRMVAGLTRTPSAVLCHCVTTLIDEDGAEIETYTPEMDMSAKAPSDRLRQVVLLGQRCYEVFGLIRRSALLKTDLIGNHRGGDNVLLYRLALLGPFEIVHEPLFYLRRHRRQSTVYVSNSSAYHQWFTGRARASLALPDWIFLAKSWSVIRGLPLGLGERLACSRVMLRYTYMCRRRLLRDLRVVAETLVFGESNPERRRTLFGTTARGCE